jgi:hypothetical protein
MTCSSPRPRFARMLMPVFPVGSARTPKTNSGHPQGADVALRQRHLRPRQVAAASTAPP